MSDFDILLIIIAIGFTGVMYFITRGTQSILNAIQQLQEILKQ